MSELIDRVRLAIIGEIQKSSLPIGTYIDSEKLARAAVAEVASTIINARNSDEEMSRILLESAGFKPL